MTFRRRLLPSGLLAAAQLLLGGMSALVAQATPDRSRHIHGIVENGADGRPLRDAVLLVEAGADPVRATKAIVVRTRADERGHFDVRGLPAAVVRLHVRAIGFAPYERRVDLTAQDQLIEVRLTPVTTTLDNVVVRADTVLERLSRVAATSSLDAAELSVIRGQTLGESIKNLPGVAVIQFGPSIAKPVIRGLNSQRVLVMNSGLRQEDQQWGTEHAPNIDGFDADNVTVVRGAATVLYGPDAIGGLVRVDRAAVPDTGTIHGDVAANLFSNSRQGAMSFGVRGGNLLLPGLGTTGYRVRLTSRVAGNASAPDYALANTGFRELNGSAALGVSRAWGHAELSLSRFATELGVLQQAHAGNVEDLQRAMSAPPADSSFTYGIGRPNQRVSHSTARLRVIRDYSGGQSLEVVYGLQFNHRREYDRHGPLRNQDIPAFNLQLFTNTLDVRYTHAPWHGWRGTIGTSALQQGNQTSGKAFLIPGYDLYSGAVYGQEERTIGRVTISASARTDGMAQTTLPYADQGIRSPAGTRRWADVSGSVGASLALTPSLDWAVRGARAWRPPTVNERYAQGVHHGTAQYELGDATLTRERSHGLETSLRYHGQRLTVDAAAYNNLIDGFIFLRPSDPIFTLRGAFPGFRYSQTAARLRGLELASVVTVTNHVQVQLGGTLVRGADRTRGGPLFDMPADRMSASVRFNGTSARVPAWWSSIGTTLVRRQDGVPQGTIYTLPTAGYGLLSLDAGTRGLRIGATPLDVSISVNNALNTRYRDYLSRYRLFVNDAGRDVVVRITAPF
jgi:iron complex outermembrane recepter protein